MSTPSQTTRFLFSVLAAIILLGTFWVHYRKQEGQILDPGTSPLLHSIDSSIVASSNMLRDKESEFDDMLEEGNATTLIALAQTLASNSNSSLAEITKLLERAGQLGDPTAFLLLGKHAESALDGNEFTQSALAYYIKAAEMGESFGYVAAGRLYLEGKQVALNLEQAKILFEKAAKAGNPEGMHLLAVLIFDSDRNLAMSYLQSAADAGNTDSMRLLAYSQNIDPEAALAGNISLLRLASASGSTRASVDLANELLKGTNDFSQKLEAIQLLSTAAGLQDAQALLQLGRLALRNSENSEAEKTFLLKSSVSYAEQAFQEGKVSAALVAALAESQIGDLNRAEDWLRRGASAGDWRSRYAFHLYYTQKETLPDSLAEADRADFADYSFAMSSSSRKASSTKHNADSSITTRGPIPLSMPSPIYPVEMVNLGIDGTVNISFVVTAAGAIENIHVTDSTHPLFDAAAIRAVSLWRVQPAIRNGTPVSSSLAIPITFRARQNTN